MRAFALIAMALITGCATSECGCGGEAPHLTVVLPTDFKCQAQGSDTVCRRGDQTVVSNVRDRARGETVASLRERTANSQFVQLNGQTWIEFTTRLTADLETRSFATVDDSSTAVVSFSAPPKQIDTFMIEMKPVIAALILRR